MTTSQVLFASLIVLSLVPKLIQSIKFKSGLHPYEQIYNQVVADNVEYLYCYNYWEFCGQLSLLASYSFFGNHSYILMNTAVICSANGEIRPTNPISNQPWKPCQILEAEYTQALTKDPSIRIK